ncbi:MAG: ACP phosphodiesterase [Bacteroidetes bacterium]|nr:ACP phosphodiesterase [Bacteroidota bacterium]
MLLGNMISDYVKGKKKWDYPPPVQQGITLHRYIDEFTDGHEATREAKSVFRPAYRLYSGAFVDVVYDHFLATDAELFTAESLFAFSQTVYTTLDNFIPLMPERFAAMFPYMKSQNWLYHYQSRWGTQKSLGGVVRRSAYLTESDTAFHLFEQHYQLLQDCYRHFWADAYPEIRKKFGELTIQP